jgi:hypothetical protein
MHQKGTDALLSAIENADGDSVELSMVTDRVSEVERIDREMEQRGGLLRAIEPAPHAGTSPDLVIPALVGIGLLVGALVINVIVGGGQ